MGIAGIAILYMFYAIYKSIIATFNLVKWSKKVLTEGTLIKLREKTAKYRSVSSESVVSTKYVYDMKILYEGNEYIFAFVDKVAGEKESKYQVDQVVQVYFDTRSKRAAATKKLKRDLLIWPSMILLCIAIVAACVVLAP